MRQFADTIAPGEKILDRVLMFQVRPDFAIWDAQKLIKAVADDNGITRMIVDSALYACGSLEAEGSMAAKMYSHAVAEIGLPATTLAHVTKSNNDPPHPYGSIFWSNGARVTFALVRKSEEPGAPRVLKLKKTNQDSKGGPQEIDWSWEVALPTGQMPNDLNFIATSVPVFARVSAVLSTSSVPMTVHEITAQVASDGGLVVSEASVAKALERGDEYVSDGRKPARWRLFVTFANPPAPAQGVVIAPEDVS